MLFGMHSKHSLQVLVASDSQIDAIAAHYRVSRQSAEKLIQRGCLTLSFREGLIARYDDPAKGTIAVDCTDSIGRLIESIIV